MTTLIQRLTAMGDHAGVAQVQRLLDELADAHMKASLYAQVQRESAADVRRMEFLERHKAGAFDEVSGPDVYAVFFPLVPAVTSSLRGAVDAAISAELAAKA